MSASDAQGEQLFDADAAPVPGPEASSSNPRAGDRPSIAAWLAQWGDVRERRIAP
jgi:hypothetical protein